MPPSPVREPFLAQVESPITEVYQVGGIARVRPPIVGVVGDGEPLWVTLARERLNESGITLERDRYGWVVKHPMHDDV